MVKSQTREASTDSKTDEVLGGSVFALLGNLDLKLAAAKFKAHDGLAVCGGVFILADDSGSFLDLVVAGDAEVDAALADKGRDIGGGEEDEGNGEVLDEGDVEAVFAAELDVGALEEVESSGIETAL